MVEEMVEDKVANLNAFASTKHPGMVGIEILTCSKAEVKRLLSSRRHGPRPLAAASRTPRRDLPTQAGELTFVDMDTFLATF